MIPQPTKGNVNLEGIATAMAEGLSLNDIADVFGLSRSYVRRVYQRNKAEVDRLVEVERAAILSDLL